MKFCLNKLEILLIFAIFFLVGTYAVPDVNEAHYIEKAAHFWNPDYVHGDFFLDSQDAHAVFYWTFGWLTLLFPMETVIWIGRCLTWFGMAAGWWRMTRPVFKRWGFGVLSALLFLFLNQKCSCAGEWVVGGVEAQGFAYVFVFFGLGELFRNRWNRALVFFGIGAMFHVLVGGWCIAALGIAWLVLNIHERTLKKNGSPADLEKCFLPSLRELLPGLTAAVLFTLPALVPALQLNADVPAETARNATYLYVYERLPHHLLLSHMAEHNSVKLGLFALLILVWGFLCARPRTSHGDMTFRTFICGALVIAMIGWGINLFIEIAPDKAASLLRYYWFRLADVMLPLGVSLLFIRYADGLCQNTRLSGQNTISGRRLSGMVLLGMAVLASGMTFYGALGKFSKPMRPRSCSGASRGETWQELCRFARENTEKDALFVVPYTTRTFRWFARRGEVGVWKDIPQDAGGLCEWWERMQDQFYAFDINKPGQTYGRAGSFTQMPKAKIELLKTKYGADYIVRNKHDLKGRHILMKTRNGIEDYELVFENKDFELRRLSDTKREEAAQDQASP